ncbi:glycoside hydrolase family 9 protein [Neptunicella marina]|uniref:Glycoside hydrolase family 9 protein n=1 Tax=Neptunicella marina TaxID=2125989 RepID=A0A8J6IZF6_9ALTE|nr:glycoside hydrolase family 9 protein [Neptunicella marina]MBC3767443.1 glycoside hydrolase family 9 protein [Neptunicella marina]
MSRYIRHLSLCLSTLLFSSSLFAANGLKANDDSTFFMPGLSVNVFTDIYPDGHQTGVTVIQHGSRVAANGDLRLEVSPGQWSPMPTNVGKSHIDSRNNIISQRLAYPDPSKNRTGFNPINYPDLNFEYEVKVTGLGDNRFAITVDLDKPIPADWVGKIGFNFELFPQELFGKSFLMDEQSGLFSTQPNGPVADIADEVLAKPVATGKKLVVAPESDLQRLVISSESVPLELWDGRTNHNNGWYIVRSAIPAGATKNAIRWVVDANVDKSWRYQPVIQHSQVGYGTQAHKNIVIEQDKRDTQASNLTLYRLSEKGREQVQQVTVKPWGTFLRYQYMHYDFVDVTRPGMYQLEYRGQFSSPFKISDDVLSRHAWQPTLEYYLPVQMCHMRVEEKYRIWHGIDHLDDARMMPLDTNHFDGYLSGSETLTRFQPGERVPGLNAGGWHDAGDYDLRVESQIGTVWRLAAMVEEFGLSLDSTSIDQQHKITHIHQPDGKNDALQQIEHGLLTVLGGYNSMGRLYRGIIVPTIPQYVMLGDAANQTDNLAFDPALKSSESQNGRSGKPDDRWVFTENNPNRELYVAAGLAAASRVMQTYNPVMASNALNAAKDVYQKAIGVSDDIANQVFASAELYKTTGDEIYRRALLSREAEIIGNIDKTAWSLGRVIHSLNSPDFAKNVKEAVKVYQLGLTQRAQTESPYGVPYKPNIWGAGWTIQQFGVEQYFVHKGWPGLAKTDAFENALNFILGAHPGSNNISFASGVGAKSATVAYGVNRADWSYIPGGVISGTALIRPDLPELKTWPFFWQQTEYVMGGGATNYMFLAMAVDQLNQQRRK